ncbi:hypothetical protein PLICRDRAFT_126998 [Plicaturopsis crispa FD-325 SS-3]|uniref:DUF6533 domain-containing protein n=1 Tax=Plicaturopsis crispa FD-325 SS-3 TaxID=944288 RepID=A0A0C9SQS9_PLICR|nr:hypothetical protein PLICRDRAFT_126998 [Plicaturopsis crispa FD-325 SS-3]
MADPDHYIPPFVSSNWEVVGLSILWFDMILTFLDEVHLIWRRPKSMSSLLYFANRYVLALANCTVVVFLATPWSFRSCAVFQWGREIIQCVTQFIVAFIFVLRTYALYGCRRKVLLSLGLVALAILIVNVCFIGLGAMDVFAYLHSSVNDPGFEDGLLLESQCLARQETGSYDRSIYYRSIALTDFLLAGWVMWPGMLAFDIIILGMTLAKTYQVAKDLRGVFGSMALATLIRRDGSIYFAAMAFLHLANIVLYWLPAGIYGYADPPHNLDGLSGHFSVFTNCLSVTLTSRLMLNLHKCAHAGVLSTGDEASASILSGIIFRDMGPVRLLQSNEQVIHDGAEVARQAEDIENLPMERTECLKAPTTSVCRMRLADEEGG